MVEELEDPLKLEVWGPVEQFFSMSGVFDLLVSPEGAGMGGDPFLVIPDFQMIGIGEDLAGCAAER